jgi:hypothetical protein
VGKIKGQWLNEEKKLEILVMIEQGKEKGLSVTRTCVFWGVNRRRVVRWCGKRKNNQSLRDLKPGLGIWVYFSFLFPLYIAFYVPQILWL